MDIPLPPPEAPPFPPPVDIPLPPPEDPPFPPPVDIPLPPPEAPPLPPPMDIPLPPPEGIPPLPPLSGKPTVPGQKKQLPWLLPGTAVILAAGAGASFYLHTENKALEEQAARQEEHAEHLRKNTADLSEKRSFLLQKQDDAGKLNQSKLLKAEENARLLVTLQKKKKEVEQLRLQYKLLQAEQSAANKRIDALKQKLAEKARCKEAPPGTPPINPPCLETDACLRQTAIAYLKARKQGNASALSRHFAPDCNYQYANNRKVPNEMVMNNIRELWEKWPQRSYRLLKVAYRDNHVELIYIYKYADQRNHSIQGYAKEKWETNSAGQIIHWREELHPGTSPAESAGYRLVPLNIK